MNVEEYYIGLSNLPENEQIPAWKALDEVCRKWAVLSMHEKDLKNYEISAGTYR